MFVRAISTLLIGLASDHAAFGQGEASAPPEPRIVAMKLCHNVRDVLSSVAFPKAAIDQGLTRGSVEIEFDVSPDGEPQNVRAAQTTSDIFSANAVALVKRFHCAPAELTRRAKMQFEYRVE